MTTRAEILAEGWLDGRLSDAEAAELREQLTDPATRQRLADWLDWRSRLQRAFDEDDAAAILHGHRVRRSAEADGARLLEHLHRHQAFARRRLPWWRVGAGLAALFLGMVAWWTLAGPEPLRLATSGSVLIDDQPLTSPAQLHDQATISIPGAGRLDLHLADRSTLQLHGPAHGRFTGLDGPAWTGELAAGQLRCQIGPQSRRRSLLQTTFADLRIEGTDFLLVADTALTSVELYEGAIAIGDRASANHQLTAGSCAVFDVAGLAGAADLRDDEGLIGHWDFSTPARLVPNQRHGHSYEVGSVPPTWRWHDRGGVAVPAGDFIEIAIDDPACIAALHSATAAMEWRIRLLPTSRAPLFIGAGGIRIDQEGGRRTVIGLSEQAMSLADAEGRLTVRISGQGDQWHYRIGDMTFTAPHQATDPLPTDSQLVSRWFIGLPTDTDLPRPELATSPFIIEALTIHRRSPASWEP